MSLAHDLVVERKFPIEKFHICREEDKFVKKLILNTVKGFWTM